MKIGRAEYMAGKEGGQRCPLYGEKEIVTR